VGEKITIKKSTKLAELAKNPESYVGKTIRLEGKVKDVCQGQGCWVEIEDSKGASFMARSLDHTVLLPKDCAGRKIVVQGVVTRQAAQGHEHAAAEGKGEHDHAHEHAKELDAGGHTCPAPQYLVATQGIRLK
jgi:hypothetical protein